MPFADSDFILELMQSKSSDQPYASKGNPFNSFFAISDFCCLLVITFANRLNPDLDRHSRFRSGSKLFDTLIDSDSVPERMFLKKLILKKMSADDNKRIKNYPVCKELNLGQL